MRVGQDVSQLKATMPLPRFQRLLPLHYDFVPGDGSSVGTLINNSNVIRK